MAEFLGLNITKKELTKLIKPKKIIITGLGALAVNFVILAPFTFVWEGWIVVISAVGGMLLAEYLD